MGSRCFRRKRPGSGLIPPRDRQGGFTLIEAAVVVGILLLMSAISVPLVKNTTQYFRLRGAVSAVTGTIQSTRYQAIFNGYPFSLTINSANNTFQVRSDPTRTGAFATLIAGPAPLTDSASGLLLDGDKTFIFSPGGGVQSPQAVGGITSMNLTYLDKTRNIQVSNYGNIRVTP